MAKLRLVVGGVDRTNLLLQEDWELVRNGPPAIDVANIVLDDTGNNITVAMGKDVYIEDLDTPPLYGLDFDGVDDRVEIADDAAILNIFDGGGTIEMWVKPNTIGENNQGRILYKDLGWQIWIQNLVGNNAQLRFRQNFSTANGQWNKDAIIPLNAWTHIAVTYNNDDVANDPLLYINGVLTALTEVATPVGTRGSDVTKPLFIGNDFSFALTWDGLIDEVRLWSDIRTASEILDNYRKLLAGTEAGLAGYWKMDENTGTTTADATSNANTGAITGAAWVSTGTKHFGGIVAETTLLPFGLGRRIHITAQDWKVLADRASVTKDYINSTDQATIQDAFSASEGNLTEIDTTQVELGRTIDALYFRGTTIRQVMEIITQITGFIWDVTPAKVLIYKERERTVASFELSDNPDDSATFPYSDFQQVNEFGTYNVVEIVGARVLSADVVDIYFADGVRTLFHIGEQDGTSPLTRPPSTSTILVVEENTGTDGTPVWTSRTVGIENQDTLGGSIDVLWNPGTGRLEWNSAPPNFANNAFRVKGRYVGPLRILHKDETAIDAAGGREYKKVLVEPSIEDKDIAIDVAMAFLRENSNKTRFICSFTKDGIEQGQVIAVTNTKLGLTAEELLVLELQMFLHGGEVFGYHVVLGEGSHTLSHMLIELRRKAGRQEPPPVSALTELRLLDAAMSFAAEEIDTLIHTRGYKAPVANKLTNQDFDADTTGWTLTVGATGSIARVTDEHADMEHGHLGVVKNVATGGTSGDQNIVDQVVTPAAATEVWSAEARVKPLALIDAKVVLRIQFLDSGDVVLATHDIDVATVSDPDYATELNENRTAPTNTAKIKMATMLELTANGGTGTIYVTGNRVALTSSMLAHIDRALAGFFTALSGTAAGGLWADKGDLTADKLNGMLTQRGTDAARPAAGEAGRMWSSSTDEEVSVDSASAWTTVIRKDQAAAVASIRTLGSGATQIAAGDHTH